MSEKQSLSGFFEKFKEVQKTEKLFILQKNNNRQTKDVHYVIQSDPQSIETTQTYLVHKNTLAQIIYESFYREGMELNCIAPVLIVLDQSQISGFYFPGFYSFYLQEEKFRFIKEIDIELVNNFKQFMDKNNIRSSLALGYALFDVDHAVSQEQVSSEISQAISRFSNLIHLHGGLKETCVVASLNTDLNSLKCSDLFLSPILITHWIESDLLIN